MGRRAGKARDLRVVVGARAQQRALLAQRARLRGGLLTRRQAAARRRGLPHATHSSALSKPARPAHRASPHRGAHILSIWL